MRKIVVILVLFCAGLVYSQSTSLTIENYSSGLYIEASAYAWGYDGGDTCADIMEGTEGANLISVVPGQIISFYNFSSLAQWVTPSGILNGGDTQLLYGNAKFVGIQFTAIEETEAVATYALSVVYCMPLNSVIINTPAGNSYTADVVNSGGGNIRVRINDN